MNFNSILVKRLIRSWAPLVWLAPGEEFLPLGVTEFLDNVEEVRDGDYLSTRLDVGNESILLMRIFITQNLCVIMCLTINVQLFRMAATKQVVFHLRKKTLDGRCSGLCAG